MEKTASAEKPILAILAGTPEPLAAYLSQLARVAGWDPSKAVEPNMTGVRVEEGAHFVFTHEGRETKFSAPIRGGKIIAYLHGLQKQGQALPEKISIGTYTLLPQDYLLVDQEEQAIRLTEKETAILVALSQHAQQKPMSRQSLLDMVWAYAEGVETHTLETHIYRLRQKIEEDPANPKILLTLEEGYSLIS